MNNKEAIKYLIAPIATSTEPSTEYLKQKEAYELAIKALEDSPKGKWITDGLHNTVCSICGGIRRDGRFEHINFCNKCGTPMER